MQEGYDEVVGYFDDSPTWLHVTYTFSAVAGQSEYDLDSYAGLTSPTALQTIADVRGPRWSLEPRPHRQTRDEWRQESPSAGTPSQWSQWGRSVFLWPSPSSAEEYTITGTRKPIDWLATNSSPDCPEEFHRLIADFTLGRTYVQQDDADTGQVILNAVVSSIQKLGKRYFDGTKAQPVVVNGGRSKELWRTQKVLGPLIYDFE
jgi:hypothetical protein